MVPVPCREQWECRCADRGRLCPNVHHVESYDAVSAVRSLGAMLQWHAQIQDVLSPTLTSWPVKRANAFQWYVMNSKNERLRLLTTRFA